MKSAITIIEKAWTYSSRSFFGSERIDPSQCIARGATLSKAKYKLYLDLVELGYDISFIDVARQFRFHRYPSKDMVKVPAAPVLEILSKKQLHIIGHANGNSSTEPGFRDYYCTTDGNTDCEQLVSLGLMRHGRMLSGNSASRYYILTEAGAAAALSDAVLLRERAQTIFNPRQPMVISEAGFIALDAIKANPSLSAEFNGLQCQIYSAEHSYYWREGGCGYTDKASAGIYDFSDALQRTHHCGSEKGIWFELINQQSDKVAA
jgi:hypothetical protein